ncbi:MAG: zf-HC2 domain-containing protein [Planctomycetota bacterium]
MRDHPESESPRSRECSQVLAALPLYVGRDLDSAELDAVALHLEGCDACAAQHERALRARSAMAAGAWVTPADEGPSLWAGVRAGLLAEGLLGARPRLVPSTTSAAASRSPRESSVHQNRWWIGSSAAAAALLFAFGLSGLLGSDGSPGAGFEGSALDVDGTHRTVAEGADGVDGVGGAARLIPTNTDTRVPGHLRRPGADRAPLLQNAVEWLPEQGIYVPVTPPAQPSLVEGPRRLRPVQLGPVQLRPVQK